MKSEPPFLPQEIIRIKRDGGVLTAKQLQEFVAGVTDGTISEGQIGAFNMAVFLQGMEVEERVASPWPCATPEWSATGRRWGLRGQPS